MEDNKNKEIFALLIAGSRDYTDYRELAAITDHLLSQVQGKYKILILQGEARGTDTLTKRYAQERGYAVDKFPADWEGYGKRAGFWRNEIMVSDLSLYKHKAAIFFWDGSSWGTSHCIGEVKKRNIPYKVWNYKTKMFMKEEKA